MGRAEGRGSWGGGAMAKQKRNGQTETININEYNCDALRYEVSEYSIKEYKNVCYHLVWP